MQSSIQWGSLSLLFVFFAAGCHAPKEAEQVAPSQRTVTGEVIYGFDDREDVYAHPDAALRTLAQESIVALVNPGNLDTRDPSNIEVVGFTLEQSQGLCSDQRFVEQTTGALCSGTLIDDDLVLTAGHCVESFAECQGYRFVFNYFLDGEDSYAPITSDDVYTCRELVVQELNATLDYAIIQLDRPVTMPHRPAPVRLSDDPVALDDPVTVIGFGSGLPAKIDNGGHVVDPRAGQLDYFRATTDTFGGNSGSGVFDEGGQLAGILVRGAPDYVRQGNCRVVNELDADGDFWGGEDITYAKRAIDDMCDEGWPSVRLCDPQGGMGSWCDSCTSDAECLLGWSCRSHAGNGAARFCSPGCDDSSDCRIDHACVGGACIPAISEQVCHEGNAWALDVCNQRAGLEDTCSASEMCQNGVCIAEPDGSDLSIARQDVQVSPDDPVEGDGLTLFATIRNTGDAPFEGVAFVQFWRETRVGPELVEELPLNIGSIAAGESIGVQAAVAGLPEGTERFEIIIVTGDVPDFPDNNQVTFDVEIRDNDTEGPIIENIMFLDAGDGDGLIEEGEQILVRWEATDPAGVSRTTIMIEGEGTVEALGFETLIGPFSAGSYAVALQAFDNDQSPAAGPVRDAVLQVLPNDVPRAPVVRIDSPEENAFVRGTVDVRGTATDDDLLDYVLRVMFPGDPEQPLINALNESVVDGVLGRWSTEDFEGPATLVLTARDSVGSISVVNRRVVVDNTSPNIANPTLNPADVTSRFSGALEIRVDVTDALSGVASDSVGLSYRFGNGAWTEFVPMERQEDGRWLMLVEADWAALRGTQLTWRIQARDVAGNSTESAPRSELIDVANDAPRWVGLPQLGLEENQAEPEEVVLWQFAVDNDTPVNLLNYRIVGAEGVTATLEPGGVLSMVPQAGFTGTGSVRIELSDPEGLSAVGTLRVDVRPDQTAPFPNPARWSRTPEAQGDGLSVAMVAEVGEDPNGVEYMFEEITGSPGGSSSGWQTSPEFVDAGLEPGRTYAYRVRMRDRALASNTGRWSEVRQVTAPGTCDVCEAGGRRCDVGTGGVQTCSPDALGCLVWTSPVACPAAEVCRAGGCVSSCTDSCPELGASSCTGERSYRLCSNFDDDPCLEWGTPERCSQGDRCDAGSCVFECRDQCDRSGARECISEDAFRVCGNFDATPCLEWSGAEVCDLSDACVEGGVCASRCFRDALEPNTPTRPTPVEVGEYDDLVVCPDEEDGYGIRLEAGVELRVTLFFEHSDGDIQLELFEESEIVETSSYSNNIEEVRHLASRPVRTRWRVWVNGEVATGYRMEVATRVVGVDECRPGFVECLGARGFRICEDLDGDGFVEWGGRIACAVGQVCSDGLCLDVDVPDTGGVDTGAGPDTGVEEDSGGFEEDVSTVSPDAPGFRFTPQSQEYGSRGRNNDGCAAVGQVAPRGLGWLGALAVFAVLIGLRRRVS